MRYTRLVGAILSIALVGLMALVATPQATAASSSEKQVAAKASARQSITGSPFKRNGKIFLRGEVTPRKGPVIIQRATRCNSNTGQCNFKFYGSVGTNKKAKYRSPRLVTRAGGDYFYRARVGAATTAIYRVFRL